MGVDDAPVEGLAEAEGAAVAVSVGVGEAFTGAEAVADGLGDGLSPPVQADRSRAAAATPTSARACGVQLFTSTTSKGTLSHAGRGGWARPAVVSLTSPEAARAAAGTVALAAIAASGGRLTSMTSAVGVAGGPGDAARTRDADTAGTGHRRPKRHDIQALRALAIGGVLVNHLLPSSLTGGYLGVDVFFVISGFLITGIIARGISAGGFTLRAFWTRRVRRLMPASFLAIAVTSAAMVAVVPRELWRQFSEEAIASTLYVENWYLAIAGSDYFRADIPASPFRHFWSLSVEEQYYVAIPIVLVLLWAALGRRAGRLAVALPLLLGVAGVASFAWALDGLGEAGVNVFYPTTTRVWEFALGGLVATLPALVDHLPGAGRLPVVPAWIRAIVVWAAWIAIVASMVVMGEGAAHPGWPTLVPTVATAAILGLGVTALRWDSGRVAGLRPLQWVGDVSYSLYLWHWPVIILTAYALPEVGLWPLVALQLALSLVLAAASYVWVERRYLDASRDRLFTAPRTVALLVVGTLVVLALPGFLVARSVQEDARAEAQVVAAIDDEPDAGPADAVDCLGAAAAVNAAACAETPPTVLLPEGSVTNAGERVYTDRLEGQRCFMLWSDPGYATCEVTGGDGSGPRVMVVGDSHMEQLGVAVIALADRYDWNLTLAFRTSCPYTFAVRKGFSDTNKETCGAWQQAAADTIREGGFDLVLTSQFSGAAWMPQDGRSGHQAAVDGLEAAWRAATDTGARVLAIQDQPHAMDGVQECVAGYGLEAATACTLPEEQAMEFDPQLAAAERFSATQVAVVDMTDLYCADGSCAPVVGGVRVYRDAGHVTPLWASTLAPQISERAPLTFLTSGA